MLTLQDRGVTAYYFVHKTGLYKVRFGDFPSKESARRKAENLHATGIIDEYYIVGPGDYPKSKGGKNATTHLRDEIVSTARSFVGVPYRWGGVSPEHGFDCSGLSMTVYHLNGLNLPRSSKDQWATGSPVNRSRLSKGDLVFFDTLGRGKISHVGIYLGEDHFIHSPGINKRIRTESLSSRYFRRRYVGARTYF
jgi:cell wall-associated NlpC family hydrolase